MNYRMPAEWEPHTGTWLAWPHNKEHWPKKFEPIPKTYARILSALSQSESVFVCVNDEAMEQAAKRCLLPHTKIENIQWHHIPTNASWTRDHGPLFVRDESGKLVITDWEYNGNGNKWGPYDKDNSVPRSIGEKRNIPVISTEIVLEGGSIDVNGAGVLLTTESCLLNKNRNPHLTKKEIEHALKAYLGASCVLWLKGGIAGDDTDGHVDDVARFVKPTTVLYAIEKNSKDVNYAVLQENFRRLKTMKDQDGNTLEIIALPMPQPVIYKNERLPASYLNFYIANTVCLVPTFRCEKDAEALKIFQNIFPDKKIIAIDCVDLVLGLGTIHCSTQQEPKPLARV